MPQHTRLAASHFLAIATIAFAAVASGLLGCGLAPQEVWVYIDNAGDRPLDIAVDGQPFGQAAVGDYTKLVLAPGEHRFFIKSGDEVLCDLTRNLELSDRFGATRRYLFNPDKGTRYQIYNAKYGASRFEGVFKASFLQYQKDPDLKRQYIYRQLLKEVRLVPGDAWNDVTEIDYVLTPPPEYVYTKGTARRTVLWRVSLPLYERYERLAKIDRPSEENIDALDELLNAMLEEAP